MQNFDLLRNVTIGQYIPTGSFVHRLDPRAKIVAATCLMLAISFSVSTVANLVLLAVVMVIARTARIEFGYILRGFVLGLPVLVFIFITQFFFFGWVDPPGAIYFEWGWLRITRYSMQLITLSLLRITSFIFLTSLITMTSTITELTHGIESLMSPLKRFRFPAHELALILTIALRFVPTLAEELEHIMKAQASRGADIGTGRRIWRPDKAAKAYLPIIVPLFINAFRRAEDLVWAMEARCYVGGGSRTKFVQLQSRPVDYIVVALTVAFSIFVVAMRWPTVREIGAMLGIGWL